MIVKRFYDRPLAQASYLIGCSATGTALVIDANRDLDQYLEAAEAEGLRITHVTETHIHADFVSGSRELAARTGALLLLSDEGDADWKYAFAKAAGARLLKDGDTFRVGNVEITVVATPGHTPEHIAFLVTDTAATLEPMAIVTGDFVFVGDVGRPDLLERAAHLQGTMERSARTLFGSLQKFRALPEWLQVWPGHGAGSACGKGLGAVPQTTVGYELRNNWAFGITDEDEFVRAVLAGQPEPPRYFAEMKKVNRQGPGILGGFKRPALLGAEALGRAGAEGVLVIDTRPSAEFAAGHIPGTLNIPLNPSFSTWAGWLVPYDKDFFLIAPAADAASLDGAVRDLAMIGLTRVEGCFSPAVIEEWRASGGALQSVPQVTPAELAQQPGAMEVIDVRWVSEWSAGHIEGAKHIPLGDLRDRLAEIPRDRPVAIHCQGGGRSAIATSLLQAAGFENVANLQGGYSAWTAGQAASPAGR